VLPCDAEKGMEQRDTLALGCVKGSEAGIRSVAAAVSLGR
jgi:hypothetical protein